MPKIDAVKELELFSGVNRSHHTSIKELLVRSMGHKRPSPRAVCCGNPNGLPMVRTTG